MTDRIKFPIVDAKGYLLNGIALSSDDIVNKSLVVAGLDVTTALDNLKDYIDDKADASNMFSGSWNDLRDKPSIPTKVSDLTNDSNFATQSWVEGKGYVTTDTTYTAGTGLDLTSGEFSIDSSTQSDIAKGTTAHSWGDHSQASYLKASDIANKADKSELFSKKYTDLTDVPSTFTPSTHTHVAADITGLGTSATLNVGVANGVAGLDGNGKVPSSQLPSYVDDVMEFADEASLPVSGESDKIYVTNDNGFIWRWSGSQYVRINDAVSTAEEAAKLVTGRKITITGDGSWEVTFDGAENKSAALTLSTTGVSAGDYTKVTVDTKGRVTAGSNPTTVEGYGITDAVKTNDARLTDARDWTAAVVTKPQAEDDTNTTSYKWTPERVRDSANKAINDSTTTLTRTILGRAATADIRNDIGLGNVVNVDTTTSDNIDNDSTVAGSKVSDALDTLKGGIEAITTFKELVVSTANVTVDDTDVDKFYRVGHASNNIVVTLEDGDAAESVQITFKRPFGTKNVTFQDNAGTPNPITDIDGNGIIREGGIVVAYWDGQSWSLSGNLKAE